MTTGIRFGIFAAMFAASFGLHADERKKDSTVAPDKVMERLREGNARFVADKPTARDTYPNQRAKLAAKQQPFAIVLTCADSRVVPEFIFDQQLGALFVLRVAGNVADPVVLGSIEYAVEHLHPSVIVVLGHSNCGAVRAAVDGGKAEGNLGKLVELVHVGRDLPNDKQKAVDLGVAANVLHQVDALTKKSTVINDFVKSDRVRLVPGVYSMQTGAVEWLKRPGGP